MPRKCIDCRPHFVYRCFNVEGNLLYVGMTWNVDERIIAHRSNTHWFGEVNDVQVEKHEDKLSALTAEMVAIKDEWPMYNIHIPTESQVENSKFFYERDDEALLSGEIDIAQAEPLSPVKMSSSLKEMSIILDMSYAHMYKMARAGRIKTMDMGGEQKIPKQEFDKICKYGIKKLPKKKVAQ